ncbi:(deoxy)nucleoside triphosphate pyrophosphohydrolase [Halobacillus sp. GSS1]|uniref:(deoxy)nucleoside triphosphate pyrophosphohydrolase n=1 Tax=Halobacillus sp. GSS1 TaxID=2815919 RepID=UPI001A8FDE53|nr:(deoxy)nucleoside triphosphate pyrophosphohydrolase [Halobacillus sp. GSS1]MBN9654705.1 (deoxy)nucleoside triphosphate pyrophosphohydrolase [Halobacillus sp. GSS1]
MKPIINVVGVVIMSNGYILCALRSANMSLAHHWEFPGGKIKENETPEEALKREIKEELNCDIVVHSRVEETTQESDSNIINLSTYKAKIIAGIPEAIEHEELRWVTIKELNNLKWAPADIPTVNRLMYEI